MNERGRRAHFIRVGQWAYIYSYGQFGLLNGFFACTVVFFSILNSMQFQPRVICNLCQTSLNRRIASMIGLAACIAGHQCKGNLCQQRVKLRLSHIVGWATHTM